MKARAMVFLLAVLTASCPKPSQEKVNRIAYDEAQKAGALGSLEFTVALRKAIARATGNKRLAIRPIRQIERSERYRQNLVRGLQSNFSEKIYNGANAATLGGDFTTVVAIRNASKTLICTGFAVTPLKIVTSDHCVNGKSIVVGGDVDSNDVHEVDRFAPFSGGGVGLLFLKKDQPISAAGFFARASTTELQNVPTMTAMGFGAISSGSSGTKSYTDVTIDAVDCTAEDHAHFGCNAPNEMVADGKANHTDTCEGDSGGPAFVTSNGTRKVAAIILRSVIGTDCVDGSVYFRLDSAAVGSFIDNTQP